MSDGNLPPGVTGREDAFGPQREFEAQRACAEVMQFTVWAPDVSERLLSLAVSRKPNDPRWRQALDALLRDAANPDSYAVMELECPWDGHVDVAVWNQAVTWECPLCGTEHGEAVEWDGAE